MNKKESLITIIRQRGDCLEPIDIDCGDCYWVDCYCKINNIYQRSVDQFKKEFGDTELLEILMER